MSSIWVPGPFVPKPASRGETLWLMWSPPQFTVMPLFALIVVAPLCEYAIFRGYRLLGLGGLLVWTPILWLALVAIHRAGRARISLSAPVAFGAYIAVGALLVHAPR